MRLLCAVDTHSHYSENVKKRINSLSLQDKALLLRPLTSYKTCPRSRSKLSGSVIQKPKPSIFLLMCNLGQAISPSSA